MSVEIEQSIAPGRHTATGTHRSRAAHRRGHGYGSAIGRTILRSGDPEHVAHRIQAGGPADEIGYLGVRAGENPGEHTILFGMEGESFSVNVRATNRDCYARGALAAAAFLASKPAGLYSMRDVLGIA